MEIGGLTLDHLGVEVKDLNDQIGVYEALGLAVCQEHVQSNQVHKVFGPFEGAWFEPLESAAVDSPIGRILDKRGLGLHNEALKVKNIENMFERLTAHGVELTDHQPLRGAEGSQVALVHPSATGGILLELVQHPGGHT